MWHQIQHKPNVNPYERCWYETLTFPAVKGGHNIPSLLFFKAKRDEINFFISHLSGDSLHIASAHIFSHIFSLDKKSFTTLWVKLALSLLLAINAFSRVPIKAIDVVTEKHSTFLCREKKTFNKYVSFMHWSWFSGTSLFSNSLSLISSLWHLPSSTDIKKKQSLSLFFH